MWVINKTSTDHPYATNIVDGRTVEVKGRLYGSYEAFVEMSGPVVGTFDGFSLNSWAHLLHEGTVNECIQFFHLFFLDLCKLDGRIHLPTVSSTQKTEEQNQKEYGGMPY